MEFNTTTKFIRVSPRKLKILADKVKDLSPQMAATHLNLINKSGAQVLKKAILSILANAQNQNIAAETLKFKSLAVMPAGAMKRFRAVSRGMAHSYKKRMSHIKIVLTDMPVKTVKIQEKKVADNFKNAKNPKSKILNSNPPAGGQNSK